MVLIIAHAKLIAVVNLSLLTDRRLSFFAAFLESFHTFALQLCDRAIVEEVQRLAHENELTSQTGEHASARVIEHVDGDDCRQGPDKGHNVVCVINLVIFEVEMGQFGQLSQLLTVCD